MELNLILAGSLGIAFLLVLIFAGVPIAFAFASVGFTGLLLIVGPTAALSLMGTLPYQQSANYTWTVLPLFMLMGQLAGDAGMTSDAYRATRTWIGQFRGGLAMATTFASTIFAAVCGSSIASAITMTKVAWPEMKKYNYDPSLSLGSILCASAIASLIPPSIAFVIYGMIAEESIGRLFIGGILPGMVLAATIIATVVISTIRNPSLAPPGPRTPWKEKLVSLRSTWAVFLLIILIMGGLWGGAFTANEAAGVGCAGTLLIGLSKRSINLRVLIHSLRETALVSGSLFILIVAVQIFNTFLTVTNLPTTLANWVSEMALPPMAILSVILLIYIILGIPLEMPPVLLLTLPIFVPLLESVGIDKVWFGILSTMTIGLASITPPVGAPMFIVHGIVKKDGVSLDTIFRGSWIYCIPIVATLIILIIFPEITLWLPNTMYGK